MNDFKLIVAGGRDFNNFELFQKELLSLVQNEYKDKAVSLVSGMARGADMMTYNFARSVGAQCYAMAADWNKYGKSAGYRRNSDMGRFADALLVFWDGKSKGTSNMIQVMNDMGKPVHLVRY